MLNEREKRIRLLSDGPLYERAVAFAAGHRVQRSQVNGLGQFSHGIWDDLRRYVNHQAGRNWPTKQGAEHPTKQFYEALRKELDWLETLARNEGLVPDGLSDKQRKAQVAEAAGHLGREFIQHLAAELQFQAALNGGVRNHA